MIKVSEADLIKGSQQIDELIKEVNEKAEAIKHRDEAIAVLKGEIAFLKNKLAEVQDFTNRIAVTLYMPGDGE